MNQFIRGMEKACKLAAQVLNKTGALVKPGITTNELDRYANELTMLAGAKSAPLWYMGYPKSICTSVNEVICHGVPNDTPLKDGDIVNIDITVVLNEYHGDCSATFMVGSGEQPKVVQVAYDAMMAGISVVRPEGFTGDIGWMSNNVAMRHGMYIVPSFGGHGIGKNFHMHPHVPGMGHFGTGDALRPNTCITVEPIVCTSNAGYVYSAIPGSAINTAISKDKSLSAQFEHTVLITRSGCVILTVE